MAKAIDWQCYAGFASAILGWTPDLFWTSTPTEFRAAMAGWQRYILGIDPKSIATPQDLARLQGLFPDS